jgi:putative transposase
MEEARGFAQSFFPWYNSEHHHSGIGFLTPEQVHHGLTKQIVKERETVLKKAYEMNPDRFKKGLPKPMLLPESVWINKPLKKNDMVLQ